MVSDIFDTLLAELGDKLQIPNLRADSNNSCLLKLSSGLKIQMEMDKKNEFLVIGAWLGTLTPGRYREDILREALRANGMPWPLNGIFGFLAKSSQLMLFDKLRLDNLRGEEIAARFLPFVEKAQNWYEALNRGEVPQVVVKSSGENIFGIKS